MIFSPSNIMPINKIMPFGVSTQIKDTSFLGHNSGSSNYSTVSRTDVLDPNYHLRDNVKGQNPVSEANSADSGTLGFNSMLFPIALAAGAIFGMKMLF